jgi:hypothetical protein
MKMSVLALALCVFLISGCASTPPPRTTQSPDQTLSPPPPDKAQIVFLQPFKPIGGNADTALYDITADKAELLNVLSSQGKFAVLVTPGRHMFMIYGMGLSELEANVEAGKRYYVVSRFRAYMSYQLRPIRTTGPSEFSVNSPQFGQWLANTKFETMSASGQSLYADSATVTKWKASALDKWSRLSTDEKEELTLRAGDAVQE